MTTTTNTLQVQITYKVFPQDMSRMMAEARGLDREVTRPGSFDSLQSLCEHIRDFVGTENLIRIDWLN